MELQESRAVLEDVELASSFLLRQALLHPVAQEGVVKSVSQSFGFPDFCRCPRVLSGCSSGSDKLLRFSGDDDAGACDPD